MLEMSLARANDRVTFGKPIATRQMIKREIAEMQTYTHALRCMVYDFGREYDKDPNGKYIEEKAAMCKLFSIYSTRIVSDGMLEIFGGDGYFEDYPLRSPLSACTATHAPCGLRKAPRTSSASPSPATARSSAARSSTSSKPFSAPRTRTNLILHEGLSAAGG